MIWFTVMVTTEANKRVRVQGNDLRFRIYVVLSTIQWPSERNLKGKSSSLSWQKKKRMFIDVLQLRSPINMKSDYKLLICNTHSNTLQLLCNSCGHENFETTANKKNLPKGNKEVFLNFYHRLNSFLLTMLRGRHNEFIRIVGFFLLLHPTGVGRILSYFP